MTPFVALFALFALIHVTQAQDQNIDQPNEVTYVDFLTRENKVRHHTQKYAGPFVLRRGQPLNLNVQFSRDHNKTLDKTRLEFCIGELKYYVPVVPEHAIAQGSNDWDAQVLDIQGRQLNLQVNLPADIPVGKWNLRISTKLANSSELVTFAIRDTFYIVFNAWSPKDQVYIENEVLRQEYVLNEFGIIYQGTFARPDAKRWMYAQFDQYVLPTVMLLLDRIKLSTAERADVVKVSRAVSAIVNSNDEGGLVVGDWSGKYGEGMSPWHWTESASIFRRFVASGYRSVKYGQCWVFGGLTTTTLRTLGIPARTISNFVSAHDTDHSLTVDKFFSERGEMLKDVNGDSIWNFHVWSDAWMTRDDLPPGYGGWQAIDATPQEKSAEHYQLGPASLQAVKEGKVDYAYDVKFVFSEVNANVVHWQLDGRTRWRWIKTRTQTGHFGRKILTKRPGANDAENIVNQYKYPDYSPESRRAYQEAARAGGLLPLIGTA